MKRIVHTLEKYGYDMVERARQQKLDPVIGRDDEIRNAHSTLMEPAAKRLAEVLDDITISDAKIPVVANVNGQIETSAADIKANLVKQAASPVLWIDCTKAMQAFGAETFVEVGPGKTLCGFNRKIDRKIHSENVEDIPSLQKTLEFFQEVR